MKLPSSLRLPCTLISAFQRLCFFDSPMKRDSLSGREGLLGFCLQQTPHITALNLTTFPHTSHTGSEVPPLNQRPESEATLMTVL